MSQKHDTAFMTSFLGVLAVLVAITFAIIFLAGLVTSKDKAAEGELLKKIEARLTPIGTVVTDPAALVKVAAAAPHAPQSAEKIYATVCSACHMGGLLGAPKVGDKAAWSARASAAGGADGLAASAIKGKNSMPPRGGDAALSDDEVKAAVGLILRRSGV